MSQITNYVAGQFSQINLDDDTKVLISIAPTEIKILQLGWFGFPKRQLYSFDEASMIRISNQYDPDLLGYLSCMVQALPNVEAVIEMSSSLDRITLMKDDATNE